MTTVIKAQPPSVQVREELAGAGRPVLVAFSTGKDAMATEIALREAGVETVLVYLYYIPGREPGTTLDFIERTLSRQEEEFGKRIYRYPHPSFYRWLNGFVFQPPERLAIIEAANLPSVDYDTMWELIREDLALPPDTLVADGVRAADSIVRRSAFVKYGLLKPAKRKVSPIADWLKAEVMQAINSAHLEMPVDYDWFGRSFDGIDFRFLEPLSRYASDDFERILDWFPLADLELCRAGL